MAVFLGLGILANAFATYFVAHERYVYFWDWSGYWMNYLRLSALLLRQPLSAVHWLMASIQYSDYNLLPVLQLVPFAWLFGTSRLTYILAITNGALLPAAFVMGLLARRILEPESRRRSLSPLLLASASTLTLHAMWAPVLRGLPDVVGVLVIGSILLLHFAKPFAEQKLGDLLLTGLLLCLLVLLRRWYAFWIVAFFPALAVAQGLGIYQRYDSGVRSYLLIARNAAIIGLIFVVALFLIARPFASRAIRTDYADLYSAYRGSRSVFEATAQLPSYFGWLVFVSGLLGLAWLIKSAKRDTRVVGIFLMAQSAIIFALFARTQDFGIHHYYLLTPGLALGIAAVVCGLWNKIGNRAWRSVSVGLMFAVLLVSSSVAFSPGAVRFANILGRLTPQVRQFPLVRNDLETIDRLLDRLEEAERDELGDIYVLASSKVLNSSIVQVACLTGSERRAFCDRILTTNDVDKRDGFPRHFLHAHYVVVATPIQYHLQVADQRVIGILARYILDGSGIGGSFQRLPCQFSLDNGVTAFLIRKVRPFERSDLDALADEFAMYYPERRELFRILD